MKTSSAQGRARFLSGFLRRITLGQVAAAVLALNAGMRCKSLPADLLHTQQRKGY
jgi:hypothetical protein